MLLAIDIGNTNSVLAIFNGDSIIKSWRVYSDPRRTGDEYKVVLSGLFKDSLIDLNEVTFSAISSVVPQLVGPFIKAIFELTGKKPLVLEPSLYKKLPIIVPTLVICSIGADLVCNAMHAYTLGLGPSIVVDFGTALTFLAIKDGAIAGTAIAPGLGTALGALVSRTAKLPEVTLKPPSHYLGLNTVESMQSGLVLGYKGLVEHMVLGIKKELMCEAKVIATGGLNSILSPLTASFDIVDKDHTIKGLRDIASIFDN